MEILKKLCLLLPPLFLTGCYEDFTPEIDTKPVLCINSLITAGEPIEVSVAHTWLYTDVTASQNHRVNDAVVSIFANGEKKGVDYIPEEGDLVRIVAESRTYGNAEAEVQVPEAVAVGSLEWDAYTVGEWTGDIPGWEMVADISFNLRILLTVNDPANTVNYYRFSHQAFPHRDTSDPDDVYVPPSMKFYPGTLNYKSEPIFSEHIGVLDAISGNDAYGFPFFTDRQFSGRSYTLNLRFDQCAYEVNHKDYSDELLDCGLILTLSTISESYYNWCNYQWNIDNGTIGDLGDIGLYDPIWGYSNVSTGAGVVAAQSCSTYILNLKDFLKEEIQTNNNSHN